MKKLVGAMAFSVLLASPLVAGAQDHHDRRVPADPPRGYGAGFTYAYADDDSRYQPFAYVYAPADDAYYADDGSPDDYVAYAPVAPARAAAASPAACGRWIWRQDRAVYEWAPSPCPR